MQAISAQEQQHPAPILTTSEPHHHVPDHPSPASAICQAQQQQQQAGSGPGAGLAPLLAVEPRHLRGDEELRRIFGSEVITAVDKEDQMEQQAQQRRWGAGIAPLSPLHLLLTLPHTLYCPTFIPCLP